MGAFILQNAENIEQASTIKYLNFEPENIVRDDVLTIPYFFDNFISINMNFQFIENPSQRSLNGRTYCTIGKIAGNPLNLSIQTPPNIPVFNGGFVYENYSNQSMNPINFSIYYNGTSTIIDAVSVAGEINLSEKFFSVNSVRPL